VSIKEPSVEDSPRVGELVSAISKTDLSTAVYAGKAFMIATGIVTVGAVAISFGVKTVMGVKDVRPSSFVHVNTMYCLVS
jgi:hypothetical protein